MLENERDSRLSAEVTSVLRNARHLEAYQKDDIRRQNFALSLENAKKTAEEQMEFCTREINFALEKTDKKDSAEEIEKNISLVTGRLRACRCAAELFCHATLLDICVMQEEDAKELRNFYDEITEKASAYKRLLTETQTSLNQYISTAEAFDHSLAQNILYGSAAVLDGVVGKLMTRRLSSKLPTNLSSLVWNGQEAANQKKKNSFAEKLSEDMAFCKDMGWMDETLRSLSEYIKSLVDGIGFVMKDNVIYTNFDLREKGTAVSR